MIPPTALRFVGANGRLVPAPAGAIAILHHAGDGNVPPVRVPSTIALARAFPSAVVLLGLRCPEAVLLEIALGHPRVLVRGAADDTVGEVVATFAEVRQRGVTDLWISTEPGHVARATMIARVTYWRRGVRVHAWPSAPGSYRSPWLRTVRDVVRALWARVTS